jgi:hypothetical protein
MTLSDSDSEEDVNSGDEQSADALAQPAPAAQQATQQTAPTVSVSSPVAPSASEPTQLIAAKVHSFSFIYL